MAIPEASNAWVPVVSSAIVGISTILGIVVTQVWNSRRDYRAKVLEELTLRQKQKEDFQRTTLLKLQVAIQRLARAVGAAHHQDNMAFKQTGKWGHLLGEDINQNLFNCGVRVKLLAARILDDELRSMIGFLSELETRVLIAESPSEAEAGMRDWFTQWQRINDRLGALLRNIL